MAHSFVFKNGSTYYLYAVKTAMPGSGFFRWHSTDKVTWTADNTTGFLPATGGTDWASDYNGNIFVWVEGSTWYALYEMFGHLGAGMQWQTGLATSADGLNWAPYYGNPVLNLPSGGCGGSEMHKVGATYYVWAHCSTNFDFGTDLFRFSSTDLHSWTATQGPGPSGAVMSRATGDEGMGDPNGQVADPAMIEYNGSVYMFYEGIANQSIHDGQRSSLKLAIAPMTLSQLIATTEGNGGSLAQSPQYIGPKSIFHGSILPGTGMQHQRGAVGCATTAAVSDSCTSPLQTWAVPFPDDSYTLVCSLQAGGSGLPIVTSAVQANSGTQFTVTIANLTAAASTGNNYDCIALHD